MLKLFSNLKVCLIGEWSIDWLRAASSGFLLALKCKCLTGIMLMTCVMRHGRRHKIHLSCSTINCISKFKVIIPYSQYAKLNFNPSPKSNQVFNPPKGWLGLGCGLGLGLRFIWEHGIITKFNWVALLSTLFHSRVNKYSFVCVFHRQAK